MKITASTIQQLLIEDLPGLDPVRVVWENYNLGQGRITVTCYGRAWTTAWFAMGQSTIEQFFIFASPDYILSNMATYMAPGLKANKKHDEAYLTRIIIAVQEALRRHTREQIHGIPA